MVNCYVQYTVQINSFHLLVIKKPIFLRTLAILNNIKRVDLEVLKPYLVACCNCLKKTLKKLI
jgi:hypothetical protein